MIISIFDIYFNVLEIALIIFLIFFLPAIIANSGTKVRVSSSKLFNIFILSCAFYLTFVLVSVFSAANESQVLKGFLKWVQIFGVSILVFIYVRDWHHFKKIYWLLWINSCSFILVAIIDILNKDIIFSARLIPDYPSVIALGLLLPFARQRNKSAVFLSVVFFLLALLSFSRAVWLVLFIYAILLFKELNGRKIFLAFSVGALVLGSVLFFTPVGNLMIWRMKGETSNSERLGMAKVALKAFSERPLTGIGTLNFPIYLASQDDKSFIVAAKPQLLEPHNIVLQIAAEEGIFGLISFLTIISTLFFIIFKESKPLVASKELSPYLLGMKYLTVPITSILLFVVVADSFRIIFIMFIGLSISILKLRQFESERDT